MGRWSRLPFTLYLAGGCSAPPRPPWIKNSCKIEFSKNSAPQLNFQKISRRFRSLLVLPDTLLKLLPVRARRKCRGKTAYGKGTEFLWAKDNGSKDRGATGPTAVAPERSNTALQLARSGGVMANPRCKPLACCRALPAPGRILIMAAD